MADVDNSKLEMPDFVDPGGYGEVSGEITVPGTVGKSQSDEYNTLDEPVRETIQKGKETTTGKSEPRQYNTLEEPISVTIMRDLRAVGTKFYHVLYPKEKKALLKEWDLWGPLILCTFLAMMVQGSEDADMSDGGPEFAQVFVIVWVGAAVVTMNTKLLGGTISFFQSVCVLGYCLLPCCGSLILCRLILIATQNKLLFILRFIVTVIGFVWATFAAMVFLGDSQPSTRKALAVYPILLFYFVISWLILSHTNV
ncbi:protein YIPF6-like isoform X1 [Penaeus japonicus]|uniref:protein YIPF6-like isoform X1 n=1 Tax=Penaeus japonicus TaxID=27405 RepID=UPI001C717A62|nr:protein YIPF6-like isoform X1 [Penaeus japonicus]